MNNCRTMNQTEDVELLEILKNETGIEIKKVIRIEDNSVFNELLKSVEVYTKSFTTVRYTRMAMNSIVGTGDEYVLKIQNSISFHFPDSSMIRISPDENDGIEITRVFVNPNHHRVGLGTKLMELMLHFMENTLGYIPTIQLECTGVIGFGQHQIQMPILDQMKFFVKFDFEMVQGSSHDGYVKMKRKSSNDLAV